MGAPMKMLDRTLGQTTARSVKEPPWIIQHAICYQTTTTYQFRSRRPKPEHPSISKYHHLKVDTRMRQAYQTETSVSFETAQRSKVEIKESITHEIFQDLGTSLLEEMNWRRPGYETRGLKSHGFGRKSVQSTVCFLRSSYQIERKTWILHQEKRWCTCRWSLIRLIFEFIGIDHPRVNIQESPGAIFIL